MRCIRKGGDPVKEAVVFFQIKSEKLHPLAKVGYKVISSNGQTIVYCTDDGPLDHTFRDQWLAWKKRKAEEEKSS